MKDELISCKTCSKEVAKSATVCPHCGAKLKLNFIETIVIIFIFIYGLLLIGKLS